MKRTLLRWHLGLGDALLCCGLVRTLVERGHNLILPFKSPNYPSVAAMFSDLGESVSLHDDILVEQADRDREINLGYYAVQHGTDTFDESRFDAEFYRQAGVPFLHKWEKFSVPNLPGIRLGRVPDSERIIIHDDAARGFNIPMDGYRLPVTANIFDHYALLMRAEGIHCINSSVAIMVDLIEVHPETRCFLHRYARPDGGALPIFGREWTILDAPL